MRERILKWLNAVPAEKLAEANAETAKANGAITSLKAEVIALRQAASKQRPIIAVDEGDPSPLDTAKRKMYIAQVAGFHKDIGAPKLKHLIRMMREEFEKVNRDTFGYSQQEYDLYLKGAINFGWLMHDWGEQAINEMVSYQQGPEESELDELKDKLR